MMDPRVADGLIQSVLYAIDKVRDLDDGAAQDRYVQFMIDRRYFPGTIEDYAEAIAQTLREGKLGPRSHDLSRRFSEGEQLAFLTALDAKIAERKPWPRPAFVKLPVERWDDLGDVTAIARMTSSLMDLEGVLNSSFDRVSVGDGRLPVVQLELRSGDVVAVIGSVDPHSSAFTLMRRGDTDAADVITHFREVTGLKPEDVEPL
jgi:hypothetical protein